MVNINIGCGYVVRRNCRLVLLPTKVPSEGVALVSSSPRSTTGVVPSSSVPRDITFLELRAGVAILPVDSSNLWGFTVPSTAIQLQLPSLEIGFGDFLTFLATSRSAVFTTMDSAFTGSSVPVSLAIAAFSTSTFTFYSTSVLPGAFSTSGQKGGFTISFKM